MLTEQQLQQRRDGIGGSEAAAVCGIDAYRQPLDIWLEKVEGIRDESVGEKECVQWGNLLEETVAQEWARRKGVKIERNLPLMRSKELPFMLANIDARVVDEKSGLEVKARGIFASDDYGPSGTDQVKEQDIIQCQHYLAVTGWDLWYMAVLIGGQELRAYVIPRDDGLIENLRSIEGTFWTYVVTAERPPIDYTHRSVSTLISRLYPGTNGGTIYLPDRASEIKIELDEIAEVSRAADSRKEVLRAELKDMIGENAVGLLPGGGGWRRKLIQKKGYEVKPSSYFDVRYSSKLEV